MNFERQDDRHYLFRNYLHICPKSIEEVAIQLKKDEQLLDSIASKIAKDLHTLSEYQIKDLIEKTKGDLSGYEVPSFSKILDKNGNLKSIKLHIDKNKIVLLKEQIKKDLATRTKNNEVWINIAEEILHANVKLTTEKMQGLVDGDRTFSNDTINSLNQYFNNEKTIELHAIFRQIIHKHTRQIVKDTAKDVGLPNLSDSELDLLLGTGQNTTDKPVPITESKLTNPILPIPTFAAMKSASLAQIRKDLWSKDDNGFAYFKHQAKGNPKNYIEHYISHPGDIELLPLEQAEQIIDKFGFNTVKLHLIFAAHTMNQERPWDGKFNLKASDIIKYLGWDKRTDLPVHQKLNEIAKTAFVLDCLLVKSVWIEGRNKKGQINASTPTGRMWNVVIDPRGQLDTEGKVKKPEEVYITVQPGLIFHSFLNKAGSKLKEALYQFGYLAQSILRIDPYHDELALRLAIHLTMESRVHTSGTYRVETLLKHLLPHTVIDTARSDKRKGYDLKQRWDNALKLLMNMRWQIRFDESYPEWLQPGSKLEKPNDARKMKIIEWLLQAKITIKPPEPIPELLAAKVKAKLPSSKQKKVTPVTGITSDRIRKARNAKGWSQRKLAGTLGVSQSLVKMWEKGRRTPSEEMEIKLRRLLEIQD